MSPEHKRVIFLEHGVGSALFNLALNGLIAWALFRGLERVPLWGQQSIAGDTVGTCFFLPFFTTLIVTPLLRGRMRSGQVNPLASTGRLSALLDRLPRRSLARAAVLGVLCAVCVAPPVIWALDRLAVTDLGLWPFVVFKATFAAALAALFTPLIAAWAIGPDDQWGHAGSTVRRRGGS